MKTVDLNCDLGEGGAHDAELMAWVTSVNIACGGHAGDRETMLAALLAARASGVTAGAHPGYEDRGHFGRREIALSETEVRALIFRQVERLGELARDCGVKVRHVKPHGALYNLAARERRVADAIAEAVYAIDPRLLLVGLAGSELLAAGLARGLRVVSEVFADRTYQADGSLTPRSRADALVSDAPGAVMQVLRLVVEGRVRSVDGIEVPVVADTVCLHGDGVHAVAFARTLRGALHSAHIRVSSFAPA